MQSRDGSKSSRTSPTVSTTRNPSRRGDQPARPRHGGGFPMRSRRFRGARTCPLPARNVRENREQEISELVDRIGMAVNSELDLKRIFQGIARAVGIVARDRSFRDLQPGFRRQVRHRTGDRDPGPVARGRRHPRPCGSHERVGGGGPPFCPAHAGGGSRKPDCSAGGAWPQAGRPHPTGGQGAPPGRRNRGACHPLRPALRAPPPSRKRGPPAGQYLAGGHRRPRYPCAGAALPDHGPGPHPVRSRHTPGGRS